MSSYTLTSSSKTRKLHIWFYYTILYTSAYVPSPYINFESTRITKHKNLYKFVSDANSKLV
jgi:hypothetical protein